MDKSKKIFGLGIFAAIIGCGPCLLIPILSLVGYGGLIWGFDLCNLTENPKVVVSCLGLAMALFSILWFLLKRRRSACDCPPTEG